MDARKTCGYDKYLYDRFSDIFIGRKSHEPSLDRGSVQNRDHPVAVRIGSSRIEALIRHISQMPLDRCRVENRHDPVGIDVAHGRFGVCQAEASFI